MKNLYQFADFFRLLLNGLWYDIQEPVGWDKITIRAVRDKEFWGMNYEFLPAEVTLIFVPHEGGDLLEQEYEKNLGDGNAFFQYGYRTDFLDVVYEYSGKINFNDYHKTDEGISVVIEKTVFDQKLRTRLETDITLTSDKNLDGGAIIPCPGITIEMHSKKIRKIGRGRQDGTVTPDLTVSKEISGSATWDWFIQPDTSFSEMAEVETVENYPLAVIYKTPPERESRYQFIAEEAGEVIVQWSMNYMLQFQIVNPGSFVTNSHWELYPYLAVFNKDGVLKNQVIYNDFRLSGSGVGSYTTLHKFAVKAQLVLAKGDVIYANVFLNYRAEAIGFQAMKRMGVRITQNVSSFEVIQETVAKQSKAIWYNVFDALNYCIESATGKKFALRSKTFGPGGSEYKRALTNGYQIRQFSTTDKPVILSILKILRIMKTIWCAKLQYTLDNNGKDLVSIEPISEGFGTDVIARFKDVSNYEDIQGKEYCYNEVEIGYNKFAEDEQNSLDEVNTYANWLLPVTTLKNKYIQRCDAIASGYSIEKQRREQFKDNPSQSLSEDDNLFILCYLEPGERIFRDVKYSLYAKPGDNTTAIFALVDRLIDLEDGAIFKFITGPNSLKDFISLGKVPFENNKYYVQASAFFFGAGQSDIHLPTSSYFPERNERFPITLNLVSPETFYNLPIAPIFMLLNHSPIINISLIAKADTEKIIPTFYKNNGNAVLKLDFDSRTWDAKAPISLALFNPGNHVFTPRLANFTAECPYDILQQIRDSLRGLGNKKYARIVHPDLNGVYWESHLLSIDYDPTGESLKISCAKIKKL